LIFYIINIILGTGDGQRRVTAIAAGHYEGTAIMVAALIVVIRGQRWCDYGGGGGRSGPVWRRRRFPSGGKTCLLRKFKLTIFLNFISISKIYFEI
jgi:hypothetical protein